MSYALFACAALMLVLVPLAPKLVRLRIRILRWLRWSWAADLLEKHFEGWVIFARVMLLVIGLALMGVGLAHFGE